MILARYARLKGVLCCISATIVVIYVLVTPVIHAGGASAYFASDNHWAKVYPFVAILAAVSVFFIARLAINVVSREATAIFWDGNILRLISSTVIQIPKRDGDKIDLQKGGAFPFRVTYLCLYLKGTGMKKVPTSLFSEPAEIVCNRVQTSLGLQTLVQLQGETKRPLF